MKDVILKIENLDKSFGITHANKNISLELRRGEVRGLAGENGSGKSTLLSQIAGIYASDSGTMYKDGKPYSPKSPIDANTHKIAMIVQELGLVGNLPASVNIFLGKTGQYTRGGMISLKKLYGEAQKVLERWELPPMNFKRKASAMNVEQRKMIELVRALSADPDILILDEVTQSLSHDNREVIYKLIQKFKEEGRSVILISHDLEETLKITDTISILRDGELIDTVVSSQISEDDLKRKMVGRELNEEYYRVDMEEQYEDEVILSLKDISSATGVSNVSVEVHKGEIMAFCGLSDSGIHDIGQLAYGLMKPTKGEVYLHPDGMCITSPAEALKHRMAYVPKDRDGEALLMGSHIMNNTVLPSTEGLAGRLGYLSTAKMKALAEEARELFKIKCTGVMQNMGALSGGNKQKVNLGRWMVKDLQVMIVDCPTRGVDVGVKAYIYQCLKEAKRKGIAILMITDELSEAIGMADHIVVMKNGSVEKKIGRSVGFREEEIIEVMV